MNEKEKQGRKYFISFLRKKLKLPVSWAWNGVTPEENGEYKKQLKEAEREIAQ